MKNIIAIIWRAWSGKDLAGDFLSEKLWIPSFTISEALRISAQKRWIEESRENLIALWKEFAEEKWDDYLAKVIVENTNWNSLIIVGMRQLGQLQYCKKYHNVTFIWIEADPTVRFERLVKNKKVSCSYDKFLEVEKLDEWNVQNVWKCLNYCECIIDNNWSISEFEDKLSNQFF